MASLREPLPSTWLLRTKVLCSAHREMIWPAHLWMPAGDYHWRPVVLELFCKTTAPFTLLSHCLCLSLSILHFFFFLPYFLTFLYLCSIKQSGIQTPIRWLFWVISLPSFLSTGFPKEVSFLPQHLVSDLFAFRSLEQSELGVCNKSNTFRAAKLLCHYRSLNTVSEDTT